MNGNTAYNEQMAHKIQAYKEAGINGIYMLESSFSGDWQEQIIERVEESLEAKLQKIRSINQSFYSAQVRR